MVVREFTTEAPARRERDVEPKAQIDRAAHYLRGASEPESTRARREESFDVVAWFALEGDGTPHSYITECWYG